MACFATIPPTAIYAFIEQIIVEPILTYPYGEPAFLILLANKLFISREAQKPKNSGLSSKFWIFIDYNIDRKCFDTNLTAGIYSLHQT